MCGERCQLRAQGCVSGTRKPLRQGLAVALGCHAEISMSRPGQLMRNASLEIFNEKFIPRSS